MELNPDILNVLSGLGVGGVLAVIFYYQNNKNAKDYADRINDLTKMYSDKIESLLNVERGRTEMLVMVIKEVTSALTRNTAITESFHRRLDETEGGRNVNSK